MTYISTSKQTQTLHLINVLGKIIIE